MKIKITGECNYLGAKLEVGEIHPVIEKSKYGYDVFVNRMQRTVPFEKCEVLNASAVVAHSIIEGVGKDAPVVVNEKGGGQSASPYRLDLVDPKAILDISRVLKEGADKYGENNWHLISVQDHLNHLLVHVYAHLAGDESDEHLAHAACRAIFALGVELNEKGAKK